MGPFAVKSDLNVNAQMRTEIDLNECEHFLKANPNQPRIDVSRINFGDCLHKSVSRKSFLGRKTRFQSSLGDFYI